MLKIQLQYSLDRTRSIIKYQPTNQLANQAQVFVKIQIKDSRTTQQQHQQQQQNIYRISINV